MLPQGRMKKRRWNHIIRDRSTRASRSKAHEGEMGDSVVGGEFDNQLGSRLSVRELNLGDVVVLAPYQHLKLVSQLVPELSEFNDEELLAIGGAHGMVSHLPNCLKAQTPRGSPRIADESLDDWDGFIGVNIVSRGLEIRLPLAAIDEKVDIDLGNDTNDDDELPNVTPFGAGEWSYSDRQYEVDEPLETSMEIKGTHHRGKHVYDDYSIPQYMAAETIQQAWKNYGRFRDMKESYRNKMQRISSSEKLVMDIAADMIKKRYKQSKANMKNNGQNRESGYPQMFPNLDAIPIYGSYVPSSSSLSQGREREEKGSYNSPRSVGRTSHVLDDAPISQKTITADSKMFVEIVDVTCTELNKVNWDSPNDPFVEFLCAEWTRKTPTRWESGSEASWQHPGILIPIDFIGIDNSVLLRVYSANLVREHMLIGEAQLILDDEYFIPFSPILNKTKTYELTLKDVTENNITGSVSIVAILREGDDYALLEAKLAVQHAEKSVKEEEAEIFRLELMKKRQEKEAERSAAAARNKEANRLSKVRRRQEKEAKDLMVDTSEGENADSGQLPQKSVTLSEKKIRPKTATSKRVSKISLEVSKSNESHRVQESKQEFKAVRAKKVVASRISERKAEAKLVETEPLYRDEKAEPKLASNADEYLKKALNEHPKLFEIRGDKKEMTSHTKTEAPEISIPKRQQMLSVDREVPLKAENKDDVRAKKIDSETKILKASKQEDNNINNSKVKNSSSKVQPLLVIDNAFQFAKKAACSIISLRLSEVIVLLGALDLVVVCKNGDRVEGSNEHRDATVELSLTSTSAFAGALTSHVSKYNLIEASNDFVCSEEIASRAISNLNVLVEGPWKRVRSSILKLCKKTSKRKTCRPSKWSAEAINSLLTQLQVRSGKELASGAEFLELSSVDSLFFYSAAAPSLLKYRLRLYQKLLCYLDDWWDMQPRQRPGDIISAALSNEVDSKNCGRGVKSKSKESSLATAPSSSLATLYEVEDGQYVKICEADKLLRNLISTNRGLGWNLSFDQVTLLSSRLAGLKGKVTTSNTDLPEVKGCRWILLTPQTSGRPHLTTDFKDLLEVNIVKNMDDDLRPSCKAALIPILSLEILTPEDQLMSPKAIKIGQQVSIAPLASLLNSMNRFEWYDRPEDTLLEEIAGNTGEVVSIAELTRAGRVGVEFKLIRGSIIEGIPVEALRNGAPKAPAGIKSPQVDRRPDEFSPRAQLAGKRIKYFENAENQKSGMSADEYIDKDTKKGEGIKCHVDVMLDIGHNARNAVRSSISKAIDTFIGSESPEKRELKADQHVSDSSAVADDELIKDLNLYYEGDKHVKGPSNGSHSDDEIIIDELQIVDIDEKKGNSESEVHYFVPEVKLPQVIVARPGTSTASKNYKHIDDSIDDPIVEAMKRDPRTRPGPRNLNNPSGIYVSKLDVPPKKNPSPTRKPLYRPPKETEKKQKTQAPLKLKNFAWLNPNGDVFEHPPSPITNTDMKPNPPFQALDDDKEFVPVTKSFGKPPSRKQVRPLPIQEVKSDALDVNSQGGDTFEGSPRTSLLSPSLEARPPTLSFQVYNDWGDGLFDDTKATQDMKRVEERHETFKSIEKKKQREVLDADNLDDALVGVEALSKALFSLQGRGLATPVNYAADNYTRKSKSTNLLTQK